MYVDSCKIAPTQPRPLLFTDCLQMKLLYYSKMENKQLVILTLFSLLGKDDGEEEKDIEDNEVQFVSQADSANGANEQSEEDSRDGAQMCGQVPTMGYGMVDFTEDVMEPQIPQAYESDKRQEPQVLEPEMQEPEPVQPEPVQPEPVQQEPLESASIEPVEMPEIKPGQ